MRVRPRAPNPPVAQRADRHRCRAAGDTELLWNQAKLLMDFILPSSMRPSWHEAEGDAPPVVDYGRV